MKKLVTLCGWLALTAGIILSSCLKNRDGDLTPAPRFSVEEAEAFFEDQALLLQLPYKSGQPTKAGAQWPVATAKWREARSFTLHGRLLVETPFDSIPYASRCMLPHRDSLPDPSEKTLNTALKLLAEKLDEGIIRYRVIEITADSTYSGKIGEELDRLSLSCLDDFSGEIRYFDLEGNYLNGIIFREGETVGSIYRGAEPPANGEGAGTATRGSIVCSFIPVIVWYEYCFHWGYYIGDFFVENDKRCVNYVYQEYYCYDDQTGVQWKDGDPWPMDGGSGSDDTSSPEYPHAQTLFRNPNLHDGYWTSVEKMTNEIREDCMGALLYSSLAICMDGETMLLNFNFSNPSSTFILETRDIILNSLASHSMFHEILHSYQSYQEPPSVMTGAQLNMEVEAWVAQYMYESRRPEFKPGNPYYDFIMKSGVGEAIQYLCNDLSAKGQLDYSYNPFADETLPAKIKNVADELKKMDSYRDKLFDDNRSTEQNFRNIQNLAKDC